MTRFNSYLLFDSTCKEAMDFYKSVFGGERVLTTVGDSPMAKMFPLISSDALRLMKLLLGQ
jgi:PhnB protein